MADRAINLDVGMPDLRQELGLWGLVRVVGSIPQIDIKSKNAASVDTRLNVHVNNKVLESAGVCEACISLCRNKLLRERKLDICVPPGRLKINVFTLLRHAKVLSDFADFLHDKQ